MLVIDALDECERDDDIRLIIYLLSQAKTLSSVRIRAFVTSRPDLPVCLGFNDMAALCLDGLTLEAAWCRPHALHVASLAAIGWLQATVCQKDARRQSFAPHPEM